MSSVGKWQRTKTQTDVHPETDTIAPALFVGDNGKIAVTGPLSGTINVGLFVMNADRKRRKNVTTDTNQAHPTWFPDDAG